MAHRSKKKHLKHVRQHEPATPKAKSPVAKTEAAAAGIAKKGSRRRAPETKQEGAAKQKGIVRRLASKTKKLAAKPRKVIARAKARIASRVKSFLDSDDK